MDVVDGAKKYHLENSSEKLITKNLASRNANIAYG